VALDYIPDTITEEQFFDKVFAKTKSQRALTTTVTHIRHFKFYCKDVYKKEAIEILQDLKDHVAKTQSIAKVLTFLDGWRRWALKEHPDVKYRFGKDFRNERALGALHSNSLKAYFSGIRKYVHQVGGIRLYDEGIKMSLDLPEARSSFEAEDIAPLTAKQARLIIENTNSAQAISFYHFMNDTAFREAEAIAVQEKNINWQADPVEVYLEEAKSKGKRTKGWRYLRPETAQRLKLLCNGDPEHFPFKDYDTQTIVNKAHNYLSQFRRATNLLGLTEKTSTGRFKINLHSWRKRCGTEFAKANDEAAAHGYLRHKKDLGQYMLYTSDEKRDMFLKAMTCLAIDEVDKEKAKTSAERKKTIELEKTIDEKLRDAKLKENNLITPELITKIAQLVKDDISIRA